MIISVIVADHLLNLGPRHSFTHQSTRKPSYLDC